ncbi:anaerobic ribonucleoside-triphosphate reductase [Patescibacteria group bacterium]|nr:anaerobic ribonucleoside-triphosphate reductase [Patescibacteria group bacterium]MBU1895333.1 anaerobic ribonucleoside-triphosphate reductase [Patescibacteria group bacterium]
MQEQNGAPYLQPSLSGDTNISDLESKRTRCEVWTRVMGYHRPVSNFNTGKKSEHYSRKHFQENICAISNVQFVKQYSQIS